MKRERQSCSMCLHGVPSPCCVCMSVFFPRVILRLFHWVHFLSHFSPLCIRTCRYHSWSRDCILQLPNTAFISFIFLLLRYIKMPIVCIRSSFSWFIKSSALSLFSFSGGKFSCSLQISICLEYLSPSFHFQSLLRFSTFAFDLVSSSFLICLFGFPSIFLCRISHLCHVWISLLY